MTRHHKDKHDNACDAHSHFSSFRALIPRHRQMLRPARRFGNHADAINGLLV
jgi:hypothetical protein